MARRGAATLHVDHYTGRLGGHRVPERFLHEAEARSRGRGTGFCASKSGSYDRADGGYLVLHLREDSTVLGKHFRHQLGDLRGGGDGVACEELASGGECAANAGLIPLDDHYLFHGDLSLSFLPRLPCAALRRIGASGIVAQYCIDISINR